MNTIRTWSLIAMGEDQQYAGNRGYADDPRRVYRYDSKVANHRNVAAGHLALIRDGDHLLGIARIERIDSSPGRKSMRRCPDCGTVDLKIRERKIPEYRCTNGHEFDEPSVDLVDVTLFEAHYEGTFIDSPDAVPVHEIKAAAPRPSDQLSIEEIDITKLEHALVTAFPKTRAALASFFQSGGLDVHDAADDQAPEDGPYAGSMADTRAAVMRSIKQRRGQRKFREALLKRYGARCVITGCELADVLEAAHIWPYRGEEDNHPQNGLLLRADLHTLFDLDLIAISPETFTIAIAPALRLIDAYANLNGRPLGAPSGARPALEPLVRRWDVFRRLHAPSDSRSAREKESV